MSSLNRLLDVLPRLVDAQTGIIHECYELPPEADAPQFFHYYARTSNTDAFSAQANFRNTGGVSTSRRMAMVKAVGESVERYCSALYSVDEMPFVSSRQADFPHIAPAAFTCYSEAQLAEPGFLFKPFTADTAVRWTPVVDLASFEIVHAPAAAIWMPYYYALDAGEAPILQPISTGLSCHCSLEEALEGALLEVIERDAFSIAWQARLSLPQIRIESLDDDNYALARRIEECGYRVHLVDATNDLGVPVILAVAFHQQQPHPPLVVGASAALNPADAIRKALEELVHTRRYMREVQDWPEPFDIGDDYTKVSEQIHHLRLWGRPDMAEQARFLVASPTRKECDELANLDSGDAAANVRLIVGKLAALGYRAYAAELTTPDVAAQGLHVVKAIVPALHPFYIGHPNRARANPRLYEVPEKLGFGRLGAGQDNHLPHPFP
jgi:ribosomal protein S12 methylthiotransferase accessory factor